MQWLFSFSRGKIKLVYGREVTVMLKGPKLAGFLTSAAGLALMILTGLVEERKTKQYIKEEVDKAFAERAKEES